MLTAVRQPGVAAFAFFAAFGAEASAGAPVTWQSTRGSVANPVTNVQSDGTPLDGAFQFELGAFKALPDGMPFVPTLANVADWEAHWCAVGTPALYNGSPNNFFTRPAELAANSAPFGVGEKAYVWGYDTRAGGGEWLLVSRPSWTWPSAVGGGGINPDRTFYTVSAAFSDFETVVGDVSGTGFLVRTAQVTFEVGNTYARWVAAQFTPDEQADPLVSGETADPDKDGFNNLFEFASGKLPKNSQSFPELYAAIDGSGSVTVLVSADPTAQVAWALEVSEDLSTWDETNPAQPGVYNPGSGMREFLDPAPAAGVSRRFHRLVATIL